MSVFCIRANTFDRNDARNMIFSWMSCWGKPMRRRRPHEVSIQAVYLITSMCRLLYQVLGLVEHFISPSSSCLLLTSCSIFSHPSNVTNHYSNNFFVNINGRTNFKILKRWRIQYFAIKYYCTYVLRLRILKSREFTENSHYCQVWIINW